MGLSLGMMNSGRYITLHFNITSKLKLQTILFFTVIVREAMQRISPKGKRVVLWAPICRAE